MIASSIAALLLLGIGQAEVAPTSTEKGLSLTATSLPAASRVLTLEDALQTTLRAQPSVRQADAERDAQDARALQARGALLPQVSVNAQYSRSTANFAPRPGAVPSAINTSTGTSLDTFDFFSFGASLNQQIYDFHQTIGRFQAASRTADASRFTAGYSRVLALLNTRVAYMTALATRALLSAANENLKSLDKQYEGASAGAEVGRRPQVDVLQAKTQQANGKLEKIRAENNYRVAKLQLNRAMGEASDVDYDVQDPPPFGVDLEAMPAPNLTDVALTDRMDIKALDSQISAQEATIISQRGRFGPTLGATLGVTESGRALSRLVFNLQFGATLTWTLFAGLSDYYGWQESHATLRSIQARRDALVLELRTAVEQAQLDVRAAVESTRAAEEALLAATQRFELADARYSTGVGNALEQADAQAQLIVARVNRVRTDLDVATARARLMAAVGRER